MDDNVFVRFMHLPETVHGFSRKNPDDSYTIVLNTSNSDEQNKKTFEHELFHIRNNDFEKEDTEVIELEAHGIKTVKLQEKPVSVVKKPVKRRRKNSREINKVRECVSYLQEYAFEHNIDYNELIMRRWEQKRLYGDL